MSINLDIKTTNNVEQIESSYCMYWFNSLWIFESITRFRQQKERHIIDLNYIYGSTGFWIHPDVVFLQFSLVTKLFLNLTDAHIAVFF